MMSHFCSPLRYPGGKNCIFPFVSQLFHENGLIGSAYAEPYAGGAGLALRLLFGEFVERIYINDLDRSVFAFWTSILSRPDDFCRWIEDVEVTTDTWHKFKEMQNIASEVGLFELAQSTFFLNRTNVSGVLKGGIIGGYEQKGKYKIDARFNKADLIARIQKISMFRSRIAVSNMDGLAFVRKMDNRQEDVFIYLDPPYFQKGSDLYMNFYMKRDHERLSKHVHKMKKKWMVSYDSHDFILNLYASKSRIRYRLSQSASNRVGDEVLIFSEGLSFAQSLGALNSPIAL
ncbi:MULTISPECIES: DNA adenine methylase [unclassified Rhodanobacter]|uniref:DNA adenine methylase n=1 Tax=unclassified Rhodanobacter TaxID=2621553 RepID=UPI001BE03849|nr:MULTISPECIES: DNA adenine methylase [unclassified Rhodanobacter]MBT2145088.1 DNA adenine methylase [Rhodanobacter sp. LX-99]MBT2149133.1 DNA adenine methylase [Rhodanobacter sp. LX-100]